MNRVYKLVFLLLITFKGYSQTFYINPASSNACYGSNSVLLTLVNNTKPIKRWEMSVTGGNPWSTINCFSSTFTATDLNATTWFRVVVQDVAQPEEVSVVGVINVHPEAKAGNISGAIMVCKGVNSGILTLAGHTGSVVRWETSADGTIWNPIAGTSGIVDYSYSNIAQKTYYRVVVQSGASCAQVTSSAYILDINQPSNSGVITGANTVCKGVNAGLVSVSGITGSVVRWESSSTGLSPWTSINETATTLNYTNLVGSTWYRAFVRNGVCSEVSSTSVAVTVNDPSVGGTTIGSTAVCSKVNSGEVTLSGFNGTIQQWQYSKDNGVTWVDTAIVNSIIGYNDLTKSRIYRVNVQNGVCPTSVSSQTKITVNPLPNIAFNATSRPQGEPITFNNTSTITSGNLKQFFWDFTDGTGSTSRVPIHTFTNPGIYNVKLEVFSDKGCSDSLRKAVEVYEVPGANFVVSDICLKGIAQFTNISAIAYPAPTYTWNFGDATPESNIENPSHRYSLPGKYNVRLVVSTPFTSSSIEKMIVVYPQAKPSFETQSVCLGSSLELLNKSSITEGYLNYDWSFGDSQTSNDVNPSHNYFATGTYTVRLITISNNSCRDTVYKPVYINPVPQALFSSTNIPFGKPMVFSNSSSITSGSYTNSWAFGDGSNSTLENPAHIYAAAGNYLVSLRLQSDSGCVANFSKTVWVYPKPNAAFVMQPACVYDSISFENQSTISSGSLTYKWKFGDGGISEKKNPKWKYSNPGIYKITLIATSDMVGIDSVSKTVEVFPQPVPEFTFQDVCDGFPVQFNSASTISSGTITSYLWDMGDGSNSIRQSPSRIYLNPGNYRVTLLVTSSNACKATITHDVVVNQNPIANFSINSVCFEQQVSPLNTSTADINSNYEWNMDDGIIYNAFASSHIYKSPGLYKVKLKVSDLKGCKDSLTRIVNIYPLPNVDAGNDTTVVLGFSTQLNGNGGSYFQWYPADGLNSVFMQNPISTPKNSIVYYLTAKDQNGCINLDSVRVEVIDGQIIIATNILTPDGNGLNDTWEIKNIENYSDAELTIFNRWGVIVYKTHNYKNDWRGTNTNNDILPDGTYYYIIKMPETNKVYNGPITILRNK